MTLSKRASWLLFKLTAPYIIAILFTFTVDQYFFTCARGSLLRADDGLGIHVAQRLKEKRPDLEVVDMSTASIEMLECIKGRDNVVIIDAVKTGAEPGTIHKITPQEVKSNSFTSSHNLNLFGILLLG